MSMANLIIPPTKVQLGQMDGKPEVGYRLKVSTTNRLPAAHSFYYVCCLLFSVQPGRCFFILFLLFHKRAITGCYTNLKKLNKK